MIKIINERGYASPTLASKLIPKGFGEKTEEGLLLSPEEVAYLCEKGKADVFREDKKMDFDEVIEYFSRIDKEFLRKYLVYKDLRERGYIVRTGFKFGAHFRVYERGAKIGQAHSKWLVHVFPEEKIMEMDELSRAIRLAQSVKKTFVAAIVDKEGSISYYAMERILP